MPSSRFELSPESTLASEKVTWLKICQYFDDQRSAIMNLRDEKGMEEANSAQEKILQGFSELDTTWEQLFLEAQMRNPEISEHVEEARSSFHKLLTPVPTPDEEKIKALREIKRSLHGILRELEKGAHIRHSLDLKRVFETVESYNSLAQKSEEAYNLITDIMQVINHLAVLMNAGKSAK